MPIDLTGKPIAITGASSGIGRATALACARAGMPVCVGARREDKLREVVDEITRAGGRAVAARVDVTSPEQCRAMVERTVETFGSIYSVFANAGYGFERAVHETTDADLREIFETNFWGSLNIIRPALERMFAARAGHVLFCSSCLSKIGVPYSVAYSATKAAQDHFGRAMRHELGPRGVHVSTVHPVGTATELWEVVERRSGGKTAIAGKPNRWFLQPPERVAAAVVRCLRRPRGEVWTSLPVRLIFAAATAAPGTADGILGRIIARRLARAKA